MDRRVLLAGLGLLAVSCVNGMERLEPVPVHVATTPVDRSEVKWWRTRFEEKLAKARAAPPDVVFLGDSITQGWENEGKAVWAELYEKRRALDLGFGGDRTQHLLWRLENGSLEGISPKLAIVMIGTNNSNSDSGEQIADGVRAVVQSIRTRAPKTKVLLLAIFPRGADGRDRERLVNEAANARIASLGNGRTVIFLDLGPKFLAADGTLPKETFPDLLHLSPKGYRIWAEAMEPSVKALLGD